MIVSYDLETQPPEDGRGSVLSIGVFDGVHLGHQAILAANVERARSLDLRSTILTFRRHPGRLLLRRAPKTLTSLEHRLELFRRAGIDHTVALDFDEELRDMPAADFVEQILVRGLDARHFVLGFDSRFGHDREGGPQLLEDLGCSVEVTPKIEVRQRAVSSTAIREAIELGDLEGAARMLGRPVSVLGRVVRGDELGRTLGFPTANLDLDHEHHPPTGVYACRARVLSAGPPPDQRTWLAVTNIGVRPTVSTGETPEPRLEVHLLDFPGPDSDGDLYGCRLEVEFVASLREERRFDGLDALTDAIRGDVAAARMALAPGGSG